MIEYVKDDLLTYLAENKCPRDYSEDVKCPHNWEDEEPDTDICRKHWEEILNWQGANNKLDTAVNINLLTDGTVCVTINR